MVMTKTGFTRPAVCLPCLLVLPPRYLLPAASYPSGSHRSLPEPIYRFSDIDSGFLNFRGDKYRCRRYKEYRLCFLLPSGLRAFSPLGRMTAGLSSFTGVLVSRNVRDEDKIGIAFFTPHRLFVSFFALAVIIDHSSPQAVQ